jgi:hypothetical protein
MEIVGSFELQVTDIAQVQGSRKRKLPSITPHTASTDATGSVVVRPVTPPPSQASSFLDSEHHDLLSWSNDLQLGSSNSDYLNDSAMGTMEFNINDLLQTPTAVHESPVSEPVPTHQMPLSLGLRPRNEQDSQCILECVRIIGDVENYIMADLRCFKILLGTVRKALNSLKTLIGLQQASRNLRCLFLFSTVMYQVLEMLETCVVNVQRESKAGCSSLSTTSSLGLRKDSMMGIEHFGMDPEEQSEWRLQIILKEVNHATEVLKKMKSLAGVGPDQEASRHDEASKSRQGCYLDLELRLEDLSTRISSLA